MRKTFILLAAALMANAQAFPVTTIQNNGPSSNRINLAILGDGFTAAQQSSFNTGAANSSNYLFNYTPFSQYRNYFNVYAVNVVSQETGAKHPRTATDVAEPAIPVSDPNNFFGSSFDVGGIHRLLYSYNSNLVYQVLAAYVPDYDIAWVLVNTPEYGGSGGPFAVS